MSWYPVITTIAFISLFEHFSRWHGRRVCGRKVRFSSQIGFCFQNNEIKIWKKMWPLPYILAANCHQLNWFCLYHCTITSRDFLSYLSPPLPPLLYHMATHVSGYRRKRLLWPRWRRWLTALVPISERGGLWPVFLCYFEEFMLSSVMSHFKKGDEV